MSKTFSQNKKIQDLIEKSKINVYLNGVLGLLEWDQEVMMPNKATIARSKQIALLSEIAHKDLISSENGSLLSYLEQDIQANENEFTDADKALVREFRRHYDRATKLPVEFVKEESEHNSRALESWRKAREKSDFSIFSDDLKKTIDLARRKAEYFGYEESPYDALLDLFEPGLTASQVSSIFNPLKDFTIDLLGKIQGSDVELDDSILHRNFPTNFQMAFSKELAEGLNYDFDAGRLDKSTHPFTTEFSTINDVRITTRFNEFEINTSIMGTIHETGHALYEQGVSPELDSTHLGTGVSLGIHESQSRMWENFVGRTPEFWAYWYPRFVTHFEDVVNLSEEEFFVKALNRVKPSFIRVEADEVTYNLHIIIRFEIEKALLEGSIEASDVPNVWNSKYDEYLGITPTNDSEGCLQDIHWSMGGLGYFPTYTIGNLYAAQFMQVIKKDIPDLNLQISSGNTKILLDWLRKKIHVYGAIYTPAKLCEMVSGEPLNPEYLQTYLKTKFAALYQL